MVSKLLILKLFSVKFNSFALSSLIAFCSKAFIFLIDNKFNLGRKTLHFSGNSRQPATKRPSPPLLHNSDDDSRVIPPRPQRPQATTGNNQQGKIYDSM